MKTVTTLITVAALATASAAVNAADAFTAPAFNPFALTEAQQAAIAEHHKLIAEQQKAFAEQQATALRNALEAQRKFAEQAAIAPTPFAVPAAPAPAFAMPEMPEFPAPFELSEFPAAPSVAGLDPQARRTEMRKFIKERREAMRKIMQEQREAAFQERDKYLDRMLRVHPEV